MELRTDSRSGTVIPLVIMCLVVMAILGVVLVTNATSQYMQTAKVAAELKLRELLLSAMEEAQSAAYDRLNRPGPQQPAWAADLLREIARTGEANLASMRVSHDLVAEHLVERTREIARGLGCELTAASVELLGFKRLSVDSRGLFEDGRIYYRDPDHKLESESDPKFQPVKEWVGSLRVRVSARMDRNSRSFSTVRDVKVVNVAPVAREFALFSFLPSVRDPEHPSSSESDFYRNDLRRGGPVRMFAFVPPNVYGRIFVRGPFLVDTVGNTQGIGGSRPPRSVSYVPTQENEWWGWGQVPATRDGILVRSGGTLVNFGMPPMRPDRTGRTRWVSGLITQRFGSAWADLFNDDPGFYILNNQRWYCESVESDRTLFSIWGNPAGGQPAPFRGVLTVYDNNRPREAIGPSDSRDPDGRQLYVGNQLMRPANEDRRYVVEPEGGLYGAYRMVQYSGTARAAGLYQNYSVGVTRDVIGKLGLHWEKRYETSWLQQFVIDLVQGGAVFGTWNTIPALLIPREVAEAVALTLTSWFGHGLANGLTDLGGLAPDRLSDAFPPGYRPPARAVTRRYARLSDLMRRVGQRPLLLDGILAFDEMRSTAPLQYQGRGVFYSEQNTSPSLTAAITPAQDAASSYLTIHHEAPVQSASGGEAMLTINGQGAGHTVNASIYATQGVKALGSVTLNGTYACGFLNKGQIPPDSSMDVYFRPPPETVAAPICAVSPRTALIVERQDR